MPGSFRIFRVGGIDIDINLSWLIILALLTVSLATTWYPQTVPHLSQSGYWIMGFVASLLLFASVLLHELAHSLVARWRGLPVSSITLFIFGGVSNLQQEPQTAGVEFQMAIVGPLTSLIIGGLMLYLSGFFTPGAPIVAATLAYLGIVNLLLGVFNMIPGFPLDGGRVLRSIIWGISGSLRTATRWASGIGQFIAFLFIFWGLVQFFGGQYLNGIWIGFIGWFLLQAAQAANSHVMLDSLLRGVRVETVMSPVSLSVPADLSIQQVVDGTILPHGLRAVPVMQNDQLIGLITLGDIRHVPREQWTQTPASSVMVPLARLHTVMPQQNLSDVLPLLAGNDINQVPVVREGQLVGMLSRDAVIHYLEVRRSLGIASRA